jgi:imidazolonepropionase-like amidohydrolase
VYADYHSLNSEVQPTFSQSELELAVTTTSNSGRQVVAHATSAEGMKRAVNAGVSTIEHGDNGTAEVFRLMKKKKVPLCPTIAASEAYEIYAGWRKGIDPDPERVVNKKKSFALALRIGVTICMGGDVGVFAHGDNAREMELMVDYGMKAIDVLRSATSVNADAFGYSSKIGRIKKGLLADVIAVEGDPSVDIKNIRKVKLVMKDGVIYKQ